MEETVGLCEAVALVVKLRLMDTVPDGVALLVAVVLPLAVPLADVVGVGG